MQPLQNEPNIAQEEHDNTYGVKKVSPYLSDNNGNLMRGVFNGFQIGKYDYIACSHAGATTDVYTFYVGGSGGTLLATVTITYTDTNKTSIASILQT